MTDTERPMPHTVGLCPDHRDHWHMPNVGQADVCPEPGCRHTMSLYSAMGPQLTAEEAKAAMLGLEEIWQDFLPHTWESSSLDDAENAYRKLSLIADGETP